MGRLGLAVAPKAEVVHLLGLTRDLQNHPAPTRDPALAPALGRDPIPAHSPEAGAGPAPLTADRAPAHGLAPSPTPRGGGAAPALAAPLLLLLLVWAPVLGLLYQNRDLEKKIKAIKC